MNEKYNKKIKHDLKPTYKFANLGFRVYIIFMHYKRRLRVENTTRVSPC